MTKTTIQYCSNHPNVETNLRCNRCEKLICSKCAVHTPTGYRCKDCVRSQQKVFDTAVWYDYPLSFIFAGLVSYLGSLIAPRLGFFVLFLAPLVGFAIAEGARFINRRRRSKYLFFTIAAGALIGGLPSLLQQILSLFIFMSQPDFTFGFLFSALWHGAYVIIVTTTVYYRISGLTFNR